MKLFSLFSRPAWESADADKRAQAVASSQAPELIERLPEIARHDADVKVRLAAVRRIDDLSLLGDRARLDLSPEVRDAAGLRLRQRLLDAGIAVEARIRIVRVIDNLPLLELVATEAVETDLRACALERIRRTSFLVERCVRDTDPALRLVLLARIDDPVLLEKISERSRKTDKQLSRLARERLQEAKLAQRDPEAIAARANELCIQLDALMRARGGDAREQLAQIESQWLALAIAEDTALERRYRGLLSTVQHMLDPPPKAAPEPEPAPVEGVVPVEPPAAFVAETPESAAAAAVAAQLAADATAAKAVREAEAEAEQARRQQYRERVQAAMRVYADALEHGRFHEARAARNDLQSIEVEWPKSRWDEAKRLAELETRYAKLEEWQQWSLREHKKRLCDAAEALIGSGLHPDALLTRVRELQDEWQRATAGDGEAASTDGLARRFRAIIARSIAPARPYLEKRKTLRDEKSRALTELLDAATTALADESLPFAALLEWRGKLGEAGGLISELVGNDRREATQRRKQLLDSAHARVESFNNAAGDAKHKLIAQLRRQLANADARDQVNIAKAAMPQWKALPRGQRKSEDALWNELRALIDPIFEREREQITQERSARDGQSQALAGLLAEFDALADSELGSDGLRHQAQVLRQRFHALEGRDREHELAFDRANAKLTRRLEAARIDEQRTQRQRALALAAAIAAIEQQLANAIATTELLAELDALRADAPPADLVARLEAAHAVAGDAGRAAALRAALDDTSSAELLAIRVEFVAGLPSPDAFREQRRAYQLERLAAKLGGGPALAADAEMLLLWREWLAQHGSGGAWREAVDQRIASAFAKLFDGA